MKIEKFEEHNLLYHATYSPLLKKIKEHGLDNTKSKRRWEDSVPGVVYLATDPDIAVSYAESSEEVPEEWLDKIVILVIDRNKLDESKLSIDENVIDNDGTTLQYDGPISWSSILKVLDS